MMCGRRVPKADNAFGRAAFPCRIVLVIEQSASTGMASQAPISCLTVAVVNLEMLMCRDVTFTGLLIALEMLLWKA
jgi:hypothetical protein